MNESKIEMEEFRRLREKQKSEDEDIGVRERGGRGVKNLPESFLFLSRVIGLLRGLALELDCECPLLEILAMEAKVALNEHQQRI